MEMYVGGGLPFSPSKPIALNHKGALREFSKLPLSLDGFKRSSKSSIHLPGQWSSAGLEWSQESTMAFSAGMSTNW